MVPTELTGTQQLQFEQRGAGGTNQLSLLHCDTAAIIPSLHSQLRTHEEMLQKDIASIGEAISNQNMFIEPFTLYTSALQYSFRICKFKHKHFLFWFVENILPPPTWSSSDL